MLLEVVSYFSIDPPTAAILRAYSLQLDFLHGSQLGEPMKAFLDKLTLYRAVLSLEVTSVSMNVIFIAIYVIKIHLFSTTILGPCFIEILGFPDELISTFR